MTKWRHGPAFRWIPGGVVTGLVAVAVAAVFVFVPAASAAELEDVVRQSLSTNPRITALARARDGIDHDLRAARGQYLPQVDLSAGFGSQRASNATTRGYSSPTNDKFISRQEAQLALVQRLFDGFETDGLVERQKARALSAAKRTAEDCEFLGLDVVTVYLEVLRQRQLKALAVDNVVKHQTIIESLREREKQGGGNVGDVTQAEGRLARARATVLQAENDLRDAEALYRRLIGEPADDKLREPPLPRDQMPADLEQAVTEARINNPTVRVFEADVAVAKRERENAFAPLYPKVNFEGTLSRNQDFDGISGPDRTLQAMVRLRWNLYRGGADEAARDGAGARLAQAEAQRDNAVLDAEEKMRRAWNSMEINKEKLDVYENAIRSNRDTLDTYKQQFELMIRTLLDVLDAQSELFSTQSQLVVSRINHVGSGYRVLAVGGRLLTALGASLPVQATREPAAFID